MNHVYLKKGVKIIKKSILSAACSLQLCIQDSNAYHVYNFSNRTTHLQNVVTVVHSEQYRSNHFTSRRLLQQFVGNISSRQIGEYQGIHLLSYQLRKRKILLEHIIVQRKIGLQLPIHDKVGMRLLQHRGRFSHFSGSAPLAEPKFA